MKSTLTLYRVKLSRDEKDKLLYISHELFKDVEIIIRLDLQQREIETYIIFMTLNLSKS